jgi:LmbE family N-acetylglucosaminyl deacetylase
MNILVIAAHPDDEVLGMGGTIKKLSKKNSIILAVVSEGASAQYQDKKMIEERKSSCLKCGKFLGISKFYFGNFPDQKLDTIPNLEINKFLEKIILKHKPKIVFTTPNHDLNKDHQIVHDATLVATRPLSSSVTKLFCYELPGYVKTSFQPNIFEDISNELKNKLEAFKKYKSEIEEFPHPRSYDSIKNLSIQRGIESGQLNAEAFKLIFSISI